MKRNKHATQFACDELFSCFLAYFYIVINIYVSPIPPGDPRMDPIFFYLRTGFFKK